MMQQGRTGHATRKLRVGELLVAEGIVEPQHIKNALAVQQEKGGRIGEILISLGHLEAHTFADFLAKQPGVASIDLSNYQVADSLCSLIPKEYAIAHEVFPIDKMGKLLTVGMVCPLDTATLSELKEITSLRVKALLCDPDDIRRAIQEHYATEAERSIPVQLRDKSSAFQSVIKLESVARLVREIDTLPTLPQTVQRVRQATEDPDVSVGELADIVTTDPPIAARLLRLANSSAYSFSTRVDSVSRACTLLGLRELADVVLSSAVIDIVEKSEDFDYEHFWQRSIFCATAAKLIAAAWGSETNPAAVFTAGLLHDIGRFALSNAVPARYVKIDQSLTGDALVAAEMKSLGIAHPEAGYILANKWSLPEEISEPVRHHHAPDLAVDYKQLTATVALAGHMAELGEGDEDPGEDLLAGFNPVLAALNLSPEAVLDIYSEARVLAQQQQG